MKWIPPIIFHVLNRAGAQCGDRTYLHEGRCVMSCPGGTSPVGTGTIGRVCAALQQHRVMRQASSPATTTLQSGTTLPTVLPTATLPEPVTTTTTQPFDIIEMCTVEGRGNCLVSWLTVPDVYSRPTFSLRLRAGPLHL